jgi:DNA repair photolyase
MVEVIVRQRRSPVLTPSSLPCLRRTSTINITEGCALGCTYCYIRGYSHYPGANRIVLFENTPELVAKELSRKRRKPRRVYFSPSSDAFQYLPQVQDVSFRTMAVLLGAGVGVSFLTKGFVTRRFLDLFAEHAALVCAQIGVTTLDRHLWRLCEPRTAPPEMRVATARSLIRLGIRTTIRLDPLIPDVTDTPERLLPLLAALSRAGVREAAASYIFVRRGFGKDLMARIQAAGATPYDPRPWPYQAFDGGRKGGRMIDRDERARRFARLEAIGASVGIRIRPCRCKNPELSDRECGIAGPPASSEGSAPSQGAFAFADGTLGDTEAQDAIGGRADARPLE